MPTVALVPLVIVWLGLGFEAKVFLTCSWRSSPSSSMRRPVSRTSRRPSLRPPDRSPATEARCSGGHAAAAISVLRRRDPIGLGRALVGVVVAEMFTRLTGLGSMVVFYGNTFRTAELFVPIVVLAILSIAITKLIYRMERRIAPWRVAQG